MKKFILFFSLFVFSVSVYCQHKPHNSQHKPHNNKILLIEKINNSDETKSTQIIRINIGQHITVKHNSLEKQTISGVLRDITDSTITVDKKIINIKDITKIIHSSGKVLMVTGAMLFTAVLMAVVGGALDAPLWGVALILGSGVASIGSFIIGMHLELKHGQFDIPQTWKLSISDKLKEKQKQLEKQKNKNSNYH